ncbi:hypothetical protein [Amycolatopsis sp. CB00013]|uniref:hypothetical protein n=1 Tax=Amycolatopsis sp. CB00013 TaxID=1703945 RepID=UPI00093EC05A|nr:hypothetical protein [Amycolatopsis sp. CB00013]OKJ97409.1 hypothetical protein AMK34_10415 [Amycolatopsis sp. CB00013]
MAARSTSSQAKNTRILWITLGLSVALNVGLVGYWTYLVTADQLSLQRIAVEHFCNEPGYSQRMTGITGEDAERRRKLVAAATCFVDYETGKSLDLDSLKPKADSEPVVPAKP